MPDKKTSGELFYSVGSGRRLNIPTERINVLIKKRGLQAYRKKPFCNLLLPVTEFLDEYNRMLHKYSFHIIPDVRELKKR